MRIPSRSTVYFSLASTLVFLAFTAALTQADSGSYYRNVERLGRLLGRIDQSYVEQVPNDLLIESAIKGMSQVLDPHTAYFAENEYSDLKAHTEGEFGGLGIQIAIRENRLTVITPIEGTPAQRMGIQAGDRILLIDGKSTRGVSIDSAVSKLRGKPGTAVTVTIWREGLTEPLAYKIVREVIKIESVPFADMLPGKVGYIKLVQFSKSTSRDVADAIRQLREKGMTSLVLDLRYNPGGLLNQAVEVSELILQKGELVVSTKGRMESQNVELFAERAPLIDPEMPLVVLVNEGSASASEIVAGAVQDWDRGIVLGQQTFGKGSVQSIFQLDNEHALKLTTAYYYTPSGRCINKAENAVRFKADTLTPTEDTVSLDSQEDQDIDNEFAASRLDTTFDTTAHKSFLTKRLKRKVWDAGGILPDVRVLPRRLNPYQSELERKSLFFRWVVQNRKRFGDKIDLNTQIGDEMVEDFRKFVYSDSVKFRYQSQSTKLLKEMRKLMSRDYEGEGDSVPAEQKAFLERKIADLDSTLDQLSKREFQRNREYIREGLKRELLLAHGGVRLVTPFQLGRDPQVAEALKLLGDRDRYARLLAPKADPQKEAAQSKPKGASAKETGKEPAKDPSSKDIQKPIAPPAPAKPGAR